MELVTPGLGLLIWMSLAFLILFLLLKAFGDANSPANKASMYAGGILP